MFVRIFQKVKGVTMRNLRDTIFYMKTNVLQDFHICISVPLMENFIVCAAAAFEKQPHLKVFSSEQ